ncbi:MAG: hypothetical protein ACO3NZ_04210 [Pirellulales bacterium]
MHLASMPLRIVCDSPSVMPAARVWGGRFASRGLEAGEVPLASLADFAASAGRVGRENPVVSVECRWLVLTDQRQPAGSPR